jgi:hypothetical protein
MTSSVSYAQDYEIKRVNDGPFSFSISGIKLNEGSSLMRESILFNDPLCPVQLSMHTTSIKYKDRGFRFAGKTKFSVAKDIRAVELQTLLYDVFGQHLKNLTNREVRDFPAGPAEAEGEWRASDNDVSTLLTTVTFVVRVRFVDGSQWIHNLDNLQLALSSLHLEKEFGDEESE